MLSAKYPITGREICVLEQPKPSARLDRTELLTHGSPEYGPPEQPKEKESAGVYYSHYHQHRVQWCMYSSMKEVCTVHKQLQIEAGSTCTWVAGYCYHQV